MPARGTVLSRSQAQVVRSAVNAHGADALCARVGVRALATLWRALGGGPVLPAIATALERAARDLGGRGDGPGPREAA